MTALFLWKSCPRAMNHLTLWCASRLRWSLNHRQPARDDPVPNPPLELALCGSCGGAIEKPRSLGRNNTISSQNWVLFLQNQACFTAKLSQLGFWSYALSVDWKGGIVISASKSNGEGSGRVK